MLSDHSLISAGNGELFVAGPDTDSWEVAPAAVQVVYEPLGLYERIAPRTCRYVMRGDTATAPKILGQLYDGVVERFFARRLATRSGLSPTKAAGAGPGQSTKLAPTDSAGRGRPREDDLREGIAAALRALPPGPWLKHRDELAAELTKANVRYKPYKNADDGVTCNSWKELAQLYPGVFDERIRPHASVQATHDGV